MTAVAIAEILIAVTEIAKISALLVVEDREPTEEEKQRVRSAVGRANSLWEAAG